MYLKAIIQENGEESNCFDFQLEEYYINIQMQTSRYRILLQEPLLPGAWSNEFHEFHDRFI